MHTLVMSCFHNLWQEVEMSFKKREEAMQTILEHGPLMLPPTVPILAASDFIRGVPPANSTNTDSFGGSDHSDLHMPRTLANFRHPSKGSPGQSDALRQEAARFSGDPVSGHPPATQMPSIRPDALNKPETPGGVPPPITIPQRSPKGAAVAVSREAWGTTAAAAAQHHSSMGSVPSMGSRDGERNTYNNNYASSNNKPQRFDRGASWATEVSALGSEVANSRPIIRGNIVGHGPNATAHRRLSRMGSMASMIQSATPKRAHSNPYAKHPQWQLPEKLNSTDFREPTQSIGPRALLMHDAEGASSWRLNELADAKDSEPSGSDMTLRRRIKKCLSHWLFDAFVGLIIAMNAVTVGLETQNAAQGRQSPAWVEACEQAFLIVYAVELCMRIYAYRSKAMRSGWIQFDALLVMCGLIEFVVQDLILSGASQLELDKFIWLRILRLARLARSLRLFVQFHVLWLLVEGLIHSFNTICSTFLVIAVLLYIFAVVSLEVIIPDASDAEYSTAQEKFSSLFRAMLTLLQFTTLDTASEIYTPLITSKPAIAIYVIIFLLTVSIAAMNLVTAQVVESALQMAKKNREGKSAMHRRWKHTLIPKLQKLFEELDTDGSGELELSELINAPEGVQEQLLEIVGMDEIVELFQALDTDGSGTVGIDEFCETVVNTAEDKPLEMIHIMKLCRHISAELGEEKGQLLRLEARLTRMEIAMGTGQRSPRKAFQVPEAPEISEKATVMGQNLPLSSAKEEEGLEEGSDPNAIDV